VPSLPGTLGALKRTSRGNGTTKPPLCQPQPGLLRHPSGNPCPHDLVPDVPPPLRQGDQRPHRPRVGAGAGPNLSEPVTGGRCIRRTVGDPGARVPSRTRGWDAK
jgi:hypothetical protein